MKQKKSTEQVVNQGFEKGQFFEGYIIMEVISLLSENINQNCMITYESSGACLQFSTVLLKIDWTDYPDSPPYSIPFGSGSHTANFCVTYNASLTDL